MNALAEEARELEKKLCGTRAVRRSAAAAEVTAREEGLRGDELVTVVERRCRALFPRQLVSLTLFREDESPVGGVSALGSKRASALTSATRMQRPELTAAAWTGRRPTSARCCARPRWWATAPRGPARARSAHGDLPGRAGSIRSRGTTGARASAQSKDSGSSFRIGSCRTRCRDSSTMTMAPTSSAAAEPPASKRGAR
jgi:hypothetical protein